MSSKAFQAARAPRNPASFRDASGSQHTLPVCGRTRKRSMTLRLASSAALLLMLLSSASATDGWCSVDRENHKVKMALEDRCGVIFGGKQCKGNWMYPPCAKCGSDCVYKAICGGNTPFKDCDGYVFIRQNGGQATHDCTQRKVRDGVNPVRFCKPCRKKTTRCGTCAAKQVKYVDFYDSCYVPWMKANTTKKPLSFEEFCTHRPDMSRFAKDIERIFHRRLATPELGTTETSSFWLCPLVLLCLLVVGFLARRFRRAKRSTVCLPGQCSVLRSKIYFD